MTEYLVKTKRLVKLVGNRPIVYNWLTGLEGQEIVVGCIDIHYCIIGKPNRHYVRRLYNVADLEVNLGYSRHGWVQFKDYQYAVKYCGSKFSDASLILPALSNKLIPLQRHSKKLQRNEVFIAAFKNVLNCLVDEEKKSGLEALTIEETKQLLETVTSKKEIEIFREEGALPEQMSDSASNQTQYADKEEAAEEKGEKSKEDTPSQPVQKDLKFVSDSDGAEGITADKIISFGNALQKESVLSNKLSVICDKILELERERDAINATLCQTREQIKELKTALIANFEPEISGQIETLQREIKDLQERALQSTFQRRA